MSRNLLAMVVVFGSVVAAADLPAKWATRIETAETIYQQAVQTADNTRFYAVQKANSARVKAFRQVLTDATKAGDFDAATAIKAKIDDAAPADESALPNPADAVRTRPFFLTALYGSNQSWTDITDDMNRMIREKKVIKLIVSDAVFKDPEPTYDGKNSFVGRYVLNGKIHIQSVYTGAELVIPPR